MSCERIAVTGASGFLGSRIVELLASAGHEVIAIQRRRAAPQGGTELALSDINDVPSLRAAFTGCASVIHAAGLAHRRATPEQFALQNVQGTTSIMRAAEEAGLRRVAILSSVAVYGGGSGGLVDESATPDPQTPYGLSKRAAEIAAVGRAEATGLSLSVLRMATVYGEHDPGNILRLIRAIDRGRFCWIGPSENMKTLIHRDDAARACIVAATRMPDGVTIFNVGADIVSVRTLVHTIATQLNKDAPVWSIPAGLALLLARIADVAAKDHPYRSALTTWLKSDIYNFSLFERTFTLTPQVSLSTGIKREVAWYRAGRSVQDAANLLS